LFGRSLRRAAQLKCYVWNKQIAIGVIMNKIFNFEDLTDYELYHMRYGKGALIVAIPEENYDESKKTWDQYQQGVAEEARKKRKSLRLKIADLKKELRNVTGDFIKRGQPPSSDEIRIKNEIESLGRKQKEIHCLPNQYYTNMQLAMFYTHNISPQSEVHTRFDRIISIEELSNHVKILLEFTDRLSENHVYHSKIKLSNSNASELKKGTGIIEGIVERIVPINNVTLEVITRPKHTA
jgi:hypothetical protein